MTDATTIVTCPNCKKRNRIRIAGRGYPHCQNCGKPLPWIVDVDDGAFKDAVLQATVPVVIDFWAPWCGPCRIVSPIVERLATSMAGKLKVGKLNIDLSPVTAADHGVQGIPTLVLFRNGREVGRQVGALPESAYRSWLNEKLGQTSAPAG